MQNFKFDFLESEFWADWGVCFKFHYREILELKMILAFAQKMARLQIRRVAP